MILLMILVFGFFFSTNLHCQDQVHSVNSYTKETLPQCPEKFTDAGSFCYIFSEKSPFPPECPFANVLPFNSYRDVLEDGPVWIPVRRNLSNGFGFLQWTELSEFYNTNFCGDYTYSGEIKGKDCLLYYNSSYTVAISCLEEHRAVCAYKKLDDFSNPLCPSSCRQSALNHDSECVCLVTSESQAKAEFLEPYQNRVYELLTSQTCSIGLERTSNGTYVWSKSQKFPAYEYWSNETVFNDDNVYGAATTNGWILTQQPLACSLVEKERSKIKPWLRLELSSSDYKLLLRVYNFTALMTTETGLLVNCFTDADPSSLLYHYPNITIVTSTDNLIVYEIDPYKYGHGHHWCEVITYGLEVVVSKVLTITENDYFGASFVAIFRMVYLEEINPLSHDLIDFIRNYLFAVLQNETHLSQFYSFRIMKIKDLEEESKTVWLNIHLTSTPDIYQENEEEYDLVKSSVQEALLNSDSGQTALLSFSSLDYCLALNDGNLTWPRTKAGNRIASSEYCFKSDGTRLQRECVYNLTDGCRWSTIVDTCEIATISLVTPRLIPLLGKTDSETWYNLSKVATDYKEFQPIDVYIVGEIFSSLLSYDEADLTTVVDIVDYILQINRSVLQESQLKMRATDLLLNQIDSIVSNVEYEMTETDFVFIETKSVSGVSLKVTDGKYELNKLNTDQTIENVLNIDDLESAVWFDSDLQNQIDINQVTVRFYFNDGFFTEPGNFSKAISTIFGITLPNFRDKMAGPVWVIHRLDNATYTEVKCIYWKYEIIERSFWEEDGEFHYVRPFVICKFWRSANFALTYKLSTRDVTDFLDDVLKSNVNTSETVSRLLQISERYKEFSSIDVFLVGEILRKVSESSSIDLKSLSSIIDSLHKTDRAVLYASQMTEGSTDTILYSIDTILLNQLQTNDMYVGENFGFIICNLNETDFSGLVLLKENQKLRAEILEGEVNITVLAQYQNLDSALVLSSELKNQMENDSRIVLTFFFSDVLFNQNQTNATTIGKIFGVILPEMGNYTGPISILHNITESTNEDHCAYWSYNEPQEILGSWKKDNTGEKIGSLVECHFWHTTHFALLILDQDKNRNDKVLELITIVNSSLSLFGLFGVVLTAILFKKWRRNKGNQLLLNFALAMILELIIFYVSSTTDRDFKSFCIVTGLLLHYTTLSQFCWVLVSGILQYKRFVIVFNEYSDHFLLKCCSFAWGFPLIPVTLLLIIDSDNYVDGKTGLCYPSSYGLYLGVWFPIISVLIVNSVIFVCVMNSILNRRTEIISGSNSDVAYQYRLAVFLFSMLGLGWIFAFLAQLDFGVVFVYIFIVFATLQGFAMFLFFVVFNKNTRELYVQATKLYYYNKNF